MLSKRQEKLLRAELTKADLLPEEEKLLKIVFPSPGYHIHDENNLFGMHRHHLEDELDGAHTHSAINPMGEHVHGELAGMALIDGAHEHIDGSAGYHDHYKHEDTSQHIVKATGQYE